MRVSRASWVVIVMGLMTHAGAEARVYRCTDAEGKVSYSQSPCPANQQSDQMRGVASSHRQDGDLCQLARELATTVFLEMSQGMEPDAVLDEYGGVNYINAPTLSVINFAASLRYNRELTPLRVGSLTFARCLEGGFGKLKPGDLPEPELEEAASQPASVPTQVGSVPMQPAAAGIEGSGSGGGCSGYRQQLARLDDQLVRKNNADQNDALSQERARYKALLSSECSQ